MSLFRRGNCYHYRFSWNGRQYRGSCKTSRKAQAEKVEAFVMARQEENKPLPGSRKIPTLAEFSEQVFLWLDSLPTDRAPTEATKRYYRIGWRLLEKTKLAGMRIDRITEDDIRETAVGSSPANTNNALRALRTAGDAQFSRDGSALRRLMCCVCVAFRASLPQYLNDVPSHDN